MAFPPPKKKGKKPAPKKPAVKGPPPRPAAAVRPMQQMMGPPQPMGGLARLMQ